MPVKFLIPPHDVLRRFDPFYSVWFGFSFDFDTKNWEPNGKNYLAISNWAWHADPICTRIRIHVWGVFGEMWGRAERERTKIFEIQQIARHMFLNSWTTAAAFKWFFWLRARGKSWMTPKKQITFRYSTKLSAFSISNRFLEHWTLEMDATWLRTDGVTMSQLPNEL